MRAAEFRVFLSSTFRDLQPEREQLVKKVFPRIRAVCRERGVEFTEIDLRWGITAEESRSGKAVRICLDEIGKCAPYFIGILGSRYGWAPGLDELQKDGECLERYPWLEELGREHKSITEMEITLGALRRDSTDSAFFYEQVAHLDEIPDYEREKFDSLKSRIRERGFAYRKFSAPEELGEHVYRDLLALLDRDYPVEQELTPVELERAPHLAFSVNRRRSYVANPAYLERFEAHIESDDIPLILWGRSGLGKSALMAYLTHEYKRRNPDSFVITHFIGAAAAGSDPEDVMRQVMMEIKERYTLDDEIPTDDQKIREEFPTWLAKVQNERLILAIDALNQLTGVAEELHWLPEFIPSHVRLIVSTTPGHTLEQLRNHKWQELELQPLDIATRERIANEYLLHYNKKLTPAQLELIATNPKCESPLFLRTLIEELRVFGRHTALDEHIASYLASNDERDLFSRILARMESDFGEATVRTVMQASFASRYGLSQTELYGITKLSQLALSEFLMALEYHLMQRTGLYTFFHNYLREAVAARYLATADTLRAAHRSIAEYWTTQPYTTRRRDEEPWQWQRAGDTAALQACLMEPEMAALYDSEHQAYEAFALWKALPKIAFDADYIPALQDTRLPLETRFAAFDSIVNLLIIAANYDQAADFLDAGFETFAGLITAEELLHIQTTRAELETYRGRYEPAITRAHELLAHLGERMPGNHELRLKLLDLISISYYNLGKFAEAEQIVREVIEFATEVYGANSHKIASEYKNLGAILLAAKKFDESETMCRRSLALFQTLFGLAHPETARCKVNLGACLVYQDKKIEARSELESAEHSLLISLGPEHEETISCRRNLAHLLAQGGDILEARNIGIDLLERIRRKEGEKTLQCSLSGIFVGFTYYLEGNNDLAFPYYKRYLPILQEIWGESHPDVVRLMARMDEIRAHIDNVPTRK